MWNPYDDDPADAAAGWDEGTLWSPFDDKADEEAYDARIKEKEERKMVVKMEVTNEDIAVHVLEWHKGEFNIWYGKDSSRKSPVGTAPALPDFGKPETGMMLIEGLQKQGWKVFFGNYLLDVTITEMDGGITDRIIRADISDCGSCHAALLNVIESYVHSEKS